MDLQKKAHVVLLSSPGIGHLIPILELGKRFHIHHNFKVTILVITSQTSQAESQILKSATNPSLYTIIQIPPSNISSAAVAVSTRICQTMRHSVPSIKSALTSLPLRPSAFIVDIFGTESLILAKELNIPKFVYVASHARYLSLFVYSPVLDKQIEGQYVDQKEPLKIPGCKSVRPEDLIDSMLDRNDVQYKEYLITANNLCKSEAILVNTWNELQHTELKALNEKLSEVPVFAVGPLVRQIESETNQDTESMMKWLEKQPKESVVYVSFGSGGTLSYDQMKELAFGLELSEQRFIWVLRAPRGEAANVAFFTTGCSDRFDEIQKQLPEGFLERIKNVGMLVQEWAPQVNVLKHPSIGCFISHCGWGSVLESLTHGVPIIAWPLYAEQSMNATLLVELGVALKTTLPPTKNVVGREEIASLVKRVILMGRNMRERVEEIKVSAEKALCEGGSSYNTLSKMAKIIKKQDLIGLSKNVHTEG